METTAEWEFLYLIKKIGAAEEKNYAPTLKMRCYGWCLSTHNQLMGGSKKEGKKETLTKTKDEDGGK